MPEHTFSLEIYNRTRVQPSYANAVKMFYWKINGPYNRTIYIYVYVCTEITDVPKNLTLNSAFKHRTTADVGREKCSSPKNSHFNVIIVLKLLPSPQDWLVIRVNSHMRIVYTYILVNSIDGALNNKNKLRWIDQCFLTLPSNFYENVIQFK